ncbi:hypothetical protein [Streptomyces radicis]|nr:hypothetical protein [Streptomyces radicis]
MDLVGACRAFVHVGERGSFTEVAAGSQPAADALRGRVARHLHDHPRGHR